MHREAHTGSSRTLSPLPWAAAFPAGLRGRFLSLSSLSLSPFSRSGLTYRSLGVASEPSQECVSRFRASPSSESPGGSWESISLSFVSLPESHGSLVAWFVPQSHAQGSLLTVGCDCWGSRPILWLSRNERSLGQRERLSVSRGLSGPPFYGIQAKNGFWYVSGASLGCILRNWENLTLKISKRRGSFSFVTRLGPSINWGTENNGLLMGH